MRHLPILLLLLLAAVPAAQAQEAQPAYPQADTAPLLDPKRPVAEIGPDYIVLQWFTATPCATRVQIRQSDTPATLFGPADRKIDLWADSKTVRTVDGPAGTRTFHTLRIDRLTPGKRYYWRLYDPSSPPTNAEKEWGASSPYRREYAVSTQAGKGRKTILHIPVKVLLMPNVIAVGSAHRTDGVIVPPPPKLTDAELARIRAEYGAASRFFFINSGMRYFVDFQFFVDDRYQSWGALPQPVAPAYQNLPVCRSYDGVDYRDPGGGRFTIVDTRNPQQVTTEPIVEERPFPGQVEQAFVRRYDEEGRRWEFQISGGGTFGPEQFPLGLPGRSQFFGGAGDIAWLVAHEFHHQMEGQGAVSFANREDDRIVYDHPSPRKFPDPAWTTAGRHGEHWDALAFWDRTLTPAQWLRIYFGDTWVTEDKDGDGVPDDDPRLPFDEKRWGSDRKKYATDGRMRDLDKLMLSTFVPAPLQRSSRKPAPQCLIPNPNNPDTDGDGIPDDRDPAPLYPYPPFIYPMTAVVDGSDGEWQNIPPAGLLDKGRIQLSFKQTHDSERYYGLIQVKGPWRRIRLTLDGEGKGAFSGEGVLGMQFTQLGGLAPDIKPLWGDAPGWEIKTISDPNGATFEFSLPNRGKGKWFWDGGGREIGASLEVMDNEETIYSVYEPYRLFYATMLERTGAPLLPADPPAELTAITATRVLKPGSTSELRLLGPGWTKDGDLLRNTGEGEALAALDVPTVQDFDLWMRFEGKNDAILAAFTPETKPEEMNTIHDYVAFLGGYGNTLSRFRLFGRQAGETTSLVTPGEHTMQLTRRSGLLWCLLDGKPILFASDPDPQKRISRLAVFGGYSGQQVIKEIRVRY